MDKWAPAPARVPAKIGVVLAARENFGLRKSGAIALCSRDFALHTRFRDAITILGADQMPHIVKKADIQSKTPVPVSIMPRGR